MQTRGRALQGSGGHSHTKKASTRAHPKQMSGLLGIPAAPAAGKALSTAGQHHLVNEARTARWPSVSSSPIACPFKGISPEDLPAAAGPLYGTPPLRRHTPRVRPPPSADRHPRLPTGFHARQSVGLMPSAMCARPIRPPAGYVHSTLVLWPLPHQEQPPAPLFPARPRENILSESGTTTKATVEITAARGEGASSEAAGPPYSLFLWRCDHREQILYLVLHGS